MSVGAWAQSDHGGVLWSDFSDTYYYRGYYNPGTGSVSIPYTTWHAASANDYPTYMIMAGMGGYGYSYLIDYTIAIVRIPKFSAKDLIFIEPTRCPAAVASVVDQGTYWEIKFMLQLPDAAFSARDIVQTGYYSWYQNAVYYAGYGTPTTTTTLASDFWSYVPIVHLFSVWEGGGFSSSGYGMAVYGADGRTCFNSSTNPLRVRDLISIDMPAQQTPGAIHGDTTGFINYLTPVNTTTTGHAACTRPIYLMPSLAQGAQEFHVHYDGYDYSQDNIWWGIYLGGIFVGGTTSVKAEWVTQGVGYIEYGSYWGNGWWGDTNPTYGNPPLRDSYANNTGIQCLVADATDYT